MAENQAEEKSLNFLEEIIAEDLRTVKYKSILTRFPPEPNGYLHIGHAKSICLNFGLAQKFGGKTNLRFDDTNPAKEETEYVDSIMEDVKWLGFNPDQILYASDYFEQLFLYAVKLIELGTENKYYAPKQTWLLPICICGIRLSTALNRLPITALEMTGVFIRCMISHTVKVIPLSRLPIPSAPLNSFRTGHCMTGS
jgi:hypothetical protein